MITDYQIYENKKLIILQKSFFIDFNQMKINLSILKQYDYSFVINETSESIECVCGYYKIFSDYLNEFNIKNKIFVLTETEIKEYFFYIKKYGWTPITYYSFFNTINPYKTDNSHYDNWFNTNHIPYWLFVKPVTKKLNFYKKILSLNRNFRESQHKHRLDLFNFLNKNDLIKDSYCSFKFISEFDNNFGEISSYNDITTNSKIYNHLQVPEIWDNAFLQIITESKINNFLFNEIHLNGISIPVEIYGDYFTEKTAKAIAANLPFVIIGQYGLIKRLHKIGFKTFGDFWDESYDDIKNYEERFEKIKDIIKWVASKSLIELTDIYNEMLPIFEHNKTILYSIKDINKNNVLKHIPTFYN